MLETVNAVYHPTAIFTDVPDLELRERLARCQRAGLGGSGAALGPPNSPKPR